MNIMIKTHDTLRESAVSSEVVHLSRVSMDTYRDGITLCLSLRIIYQYVLMRVYSMSGLLVEEPGNTAL
jgi:hypothetical protein